MMSGPVCSIPRFIPAHAGNTVDPLDRNTDTPVHPRACGEHTAVGLHLLAARGSSPRMRGTLLNVFWGLYMHRFIPAHAGNTSVSG